MAPCSPLHPIGKHSVNQLNMAVPIRLAPLGLVVQAVRPEMPASAVNLGTSAVPRSKKRRRRWPVVRGALLIEGRRLAHTERVRDLVHGRALRHVGPVRAEPEVPVVVGLGRGHAGRVVDADGLASVRVAGVPRDGLLHSRLDLSVRIRLVARRVGGFLQRPIYGCRGGGCV